MALWIAMAVLAAAACLPLLVALGRSSSAGRSASGQAIAIYRDQLEEVGRDVARGVIADGEAGAARTEIGRRLIREGESLSPLPSTGASTVDRRRTIAAFAIVATPLAALGLYLIVGSPQSPDRPLSARPEAVALQDITKLVSTVEAHLAAQPEDGKGWEVIAPVYAKLGRDDDAVNAYAKALAILGPTAAREASLGEAVVRASNGTVTGEAEAAFARARALAPDDPRPRFYLALALSQRGRTEEARSAWRALLEGAPADAAWLPLAKAQLAALEAGGPGAADIAAAAEFSPEQRQQMIEGMVASLAERLKTDSADAEGWAQLMRSYMVLAREAEARAALATARAALANNPAKLALVDAAARELGLMETQP